VILSTQPTGDGYAGDQSLFAPPFVTSEEELSEMVSRFASVVRDIAEEVDRQLSAGEATPAAVSAGDSQ
jgi:hypothetical protein